MSQALASSLGTQLRGITLQRATAVNTDSARTAKCAQFLRIEARKNEASRGKNVLQKAAPLIAAAPILSFQGVAKAIEIQDIQDALTRAQEVSKIVGENASVALDVTKDVFGQVVEAVKPAVEAAAPVVKDATTSAFQAASPVASDIANQAEKALREAGVDTKPVLKAAQTAAGIAGETAKSALEVGTPYAQSTFETLLAQDPAILAAGTGVLGLLYLLAPTIGASVGTSLRGYLGDVTAPQTVDLLNNQDYTLIDVRTEKEKSKSGIPSLPRNVKRKLVAVAVEELSNKVKGLLRDPRRVEAEVAAIKIANLKRLNRGSNIVILDSYGDIAKLVAKSLTNLGFKNTYVMTDGFEGRVGWVQSRLQTETYNLSFAEVFTPSRIIAAGSTKKVAAPRSTQVLDVPRFGTRLLPGADKSG